MYVEKAREGKAREENDERWWYEMKKERERTKKDW